LWAGSYLPGRLLWIPFLWALLGINAALKLSIIEDFGLLIAGIIGTMLILNKNRFLHPKDKSKIKGADTKSCT
jgi:hypothetical protein